MFEAFRQGLRDLDYVDGKNIVIVHRYAEGRLDRMPPFVHEFVQQKVDVIIGVNNVVIRAAEKATKTIPIVMISSVDPVAAGYVESFARPGGNITGLAWLARELSAKRLELLKEVLPKLTRAAILWDADGPGPAVAFKEYTAAAPAFKLDLQSPEVRGSNPDFVGAFEARKDRPHGSAHSRRKPIDVSTLEINFRARDETWLAFDDRRGSICNCRRADFLRSELRRFIPARRRLRRPDPQGRQAGPPTCRAADGFRDFHQPKDGETTRR